MILTLILALIFGIGATSELRFLWATPDAFIPLFPYLGCSSNSVWKGGGEEVTPACAFRLSPLVRRTHASSVGHPPNEAKGGGERRKKKTTTGPVALPS